MVFSRNPSLTCIKCVLHSVQYITSLSAQCISSIGQLDCQSLTLASDNQSLTFALGSKSLVLASAFGHQSLALASALDCQSLALSLEVVLDMAFNIQIFWQPTQHRLAFSQVLRFHS